MTVRSQLWAFFVAQRNTGEAVCFTYFKILSPFSIISSV